MMPLDIRHSFRPIGSPIARRLGSMNQKLLVQLTILAFIILLGFWGGTTYVFGADREVKLSNPKDHQPGDAKTAKTLTEQGRELLEKATETIWEAKSPAERKNSEKLRMKARGLLAKARKALQAAHDQYKAAFTAFPAFISQETEEEEYIARQEAEVAYMRSQIDLAQCTYAEAQTHAQDSQEFKEQITQAAKEYQNVHEKYRSFVVGLHARMWQGKCLEESNEIGKALGIYNELLAHPSSSDAMQKLRHMVQHFRLICLNYDERREDKKKLVINEAAAWLAKDQDNAVTTVELGVRYQKR